jgi:hypothetical protein
MKKRSLCFLITFLVTLPLETPAAELTGRDIALKVDAVNTSMDGKRTAIMVINRKGQKLVRKMESCNKKYGQDERGLIKFVDPPDSRGIMYLTWSYEDIERDDDMWVFLPAESLVRRISGGGKKGSATRLTDSTLQKVLKGPRFGVSMR